MQEVDCHATTGPPQNWSPGPFMAATAGPPELLRHCRWSSQTTGSIYIIRVPDQLWRRGWSPLPQLVPRIIQRLLLFY